MNVLKRFLTVSRLLMIGSAAMLTGCTGGAPTTTNANIQATAQVAVYTGAILVFNTKPS